MGQDGRTDRGSYSFFQWPVDGPGKRATGALAGKSYLF